MKKDEIVNIPFVAHESSINRMERANKRLGIIAIIELILILAMFPNNILLITMRGHIVCSKNGTIYDTFDCRDRQVEDVWLVS